MVYHPIHPYLTDQSTIDDLIKEVKRSECPLNLLDSDHLFIDTLRVRKKNFNYWPREVRLKTINGEEMLTGVCLMSAHRYIDINLVFCYRFILLSKEHIY